MKNPLVEVVNKYLWHLGREHLRIRYVQRGLEGSSNQLLVGANIERVDDFGIDTRDGRLIPWHRVTCIVSDQPNELLYGIRGEEEVVWQNRDKSIPAPTTSGIVPVFKMTIDS